MGTKKQVVLILLMLLSFFVFADSFVVKEIALMDKNDEYFELVSAAKKKLCDQLSTAEESIAKEGVYELSYGMYYPIVLIYFDYKINMFSNETYLCVCFLDEEHKLASLDIHECKSRKIDEIFVLPKSH